MVRKERALGSKRVKSMFVALVGRRGRVAPLLAESEEEEGKDDDTLIVDVVRLITCCNRWSGMRESRMNVQYHRREEGSVLGKRDGQ